MCIYTHIYIEYYLSVCLFVGCLFAVLLFCFVVCVFECFGFACIHRLCGYLVLCILLYSFTCLSGHGFVVCMYNGLLWIVYFIHMYKHVIPDVSIRLWVSLLVFLFKFKYGYVFFR